jgi:SAM-dependent methyltransferase
MPMARDGWGRLDEVIRTGRPLPSAEDDEGRRRFHAHLFDAGRAAARDLAPILAPSLGDGSLLDVGCGAGTYAAACLEAAPRACATLVDRAEVLGLARERLGDDPRLRLVAGDLFQADLGTGHSVALLANVLHILADDECRRLVARVAAATRAGGLVVVKDLLVEPDRSGPAEGLYFALNMALYTEGGDVHDPVRIAAWLREAGCETVSERQLPSSPDATVMIGRRG